MDIEYDIGKDSYILGSEDENSVRAGCQSGEGIINFQFGKVWAYEKVWSLIILYKLVDGKILFRRTTSSRMLTSCLALVGPWDCGWGGLS